MIRLSNISFVLIILLSQCSTEKELDETVKYQISLNKKSISSLTEAVHFEKFIFLESHPDAIINQIKRLYVTKDSELIVFDKKGMKIIVFSPSGKFIKTIGMQGKGPKDFYNPQDVAFNKENNIIYVLNQNKSIQVYNFNGSFIKSIKIDSWGNSIFYYNNNLFIYRAGSLIDNENYLLTKLDLFGKVIDKFIPISNKKNAFNYLTANNFVKTISDFKFFQSFDYTIYSYSNQKLNPAIVFDFLNNSSPKDYLSTLKTQKEFRDFISNSKFVHSIDVFLELENYIYIKFMLQHKTYSFYINKETKQIKKYSHNNLHDLFVQVTAFAIHEDNLVNVYYPHYRLSKGINYKFRLRYSKDRVNDKLYNKYNMLLNLDLKENPVLIFTKPVF